MTATAAMSAGLNEDVRIGLVQGESYFGPTRASRRGIAQTGRRKVTPAWASLGLMQKQQNPTRKARVNALSLHHQHLVLVAGAVVVVSSQAFSPGTLEWIAFDISLEVLGMTAVAQVSRTRGSA